MRPPIGSSINRVTVGRGRGGSLAAWEERFAPYVRAVRERFGFLESRGYGAARVSIGPRECTIVYWGDDGRANVALYNDLGGEPWAQIVPLSMTRADRTTRTFGLNEAIAVIAPDLEAPARKPTPLAESDERAWLDWYAGFLETHLDEVTRTSPELLDAIEARRA
jgi:hypothetical protein